MRRAIALPVLGVLVLLTGCRDDRGPSLIARLGEPPAAEFLAPEELFREIEVVSIPVPDGVAPRPNAPNPPIADVAVRIAAAEVQVVEVTMLDMPRGELHLVWEVDGVEDGVDRRSILPGMQVPGDERKVFRFDVASEPEWRGSISRLQLYTGARHRSAVRLGGIRGLGWRPREAAEARVALRPRWVDLGNDVRPAVLVGETRPYEVERTVGRRERLRAEVGVGRGATSEMEFVLEVMERGRVVRSRSLCRVESAQAERWLEIEEDLGDLSGRTVTLRFEAREVNRSDRRAPFAYVANPRIVGPAGGPGQPNVIVVSIDTLRADALSLYGADRPTSPHLDARAGRTGVVFEDAIAPAPSTLPSHASLFTGLDALRHHAVFRAAPPGLETLAELLRARGYRTFARTGGGYLHPRWGLVQGFDRYAYWLNTYDRDGELEAGMKEALALLDGEHEAPFFLFLHTYEVHSPYRVRQPHHGELWPGVEAPPELVWIEAEEPTAETGYRVPRRAEYRLGGPDPNERTGPRVGADVARRLYDSSVAYVDAQLERLWRTLDRLDLWRETIVVVTSDHGEAFGEHGVAGHGYLYDDNLRVPLVLFAPQVGESVRIEEQVRLVDVLPTILELAGAAVPPGIDGRSLVRRILEGRDPGLSREAWSYAGNSGEGVALRVAGRAKLILDDSSTSGQLPRRQLFDLVSDPGELVNRERGDPLADRLESEVEARLLRELAGLRIEVRTSVGSGARLRLSGEGVDPGSTKLLGGDRTDVTWIERRPSVRPRPGEPVILILQGALGESLAATIVGKDGHPSDGPGSRLAISLERSPARWTWNGSAGWREDGPSDAELELRVRWNGESGRAAPTGARPDTELIRQLQALGYVH